MFKRLIIILLISVANQASGQQLIGLTTNNYLAVNQLQLNPAYVNNARFAPEFSLFSVSVLAGNNMYSVSSQWLLSGAETDARLGKEYVQLNNSQNKKAWVNLDITGPAFSFTYKKKYQFGLYTRFRTIVNGGNIPQHSAEVYTSDSTNTEYYRHSLEFSKVGASAHGFGEVGLTIGTMLHEDDMYKVSGGITIKYLVGYAAIDLYSKKLAYSRSGDSIFNASGDVAAMYTYNATPNGTGDLSQRAGKGGLGFDIGVQYHYFPDGDPNKEIPYKVSIATSITDIGSVGYVADAGSGKYEVNASKSFVHDYEMAGTDNNEPYSYLSRLTTEKIIYKNDKLEKFRIGLPTAFRLNFDYNVGGGLYLSANTLINLRGNSGTVYRPQYISYINVTPRYEIYKSIKLGLPISMLRYRDLTVGAIVYLGPLYIGSTTFLSSIAMSKQFKDIDLYAGMGIRFIKHERVYRGSTYDNGYDSPGGGFLKRLIPGFLRRDRSIVCPK